MTQLRPLKWFREASPYINAHRGSTFVLSLPVSALHSGNVSNIIADIALLSSLGIKLVIVFAIEPRGSSASAITPPEAVDRLLAESGRVRATIEAHFSTGILSTPLQGSTLEVVSGNFVKARPLGIINGIDHHHAGEVRRINVAGIRHQLAREAIVIIPPIGYSSTGDVLTLDADTLAREAAVALGADKLVYFLPEAGLLAEDGTTISELQTDQLDQAGLSAGDSQLLSHCRTACEAGVTRCALVSHENDGALLEELFTRDGSGTQIVLRSYERLRKARPDDIAAMLQLIEPLQLDGILVARSRELIESEISHFTVIERDGLVIGCAALYPFADEAELACLATHPDYRDGDRGDMLLNAIVTEAEAAGMNALFVLTTRAAHWFRERGFTSSERDSLPPERLQTYNLDRQSQVLRLSLDANAVVDIRAQRRPTP